MINDDISHIFQNMSSYFQMSKEKNAFFKARAYRKASDVIGKFPYDLSDKEWYLDLRKMERLEGIGKTTALQIKEYVETGKIEEYEEMKKNSPVKLEELLNIQGIGPKKILKLHKEIGITDIDSLKKAAEENKIASLDGFGKKTEINILENIEFAIVNKDRISIEKADEIVEDIKKYLSSDKNIINIEISGSYRRRCETIGDIDILISSKNPAKTTKHFTSYNNIEKILGEGTTKSSIWLKSKTQVDMRIVTDDQFGAALQYFTGSKDHNVKLRNIAIKKNYKLSEYGLFERNQNNNDKQSKLIESKSENLIYEKLDLKFVEPELRENLGEIEAAIENKLPNLITIDDIKGDLQMHSTNSDGKNSIKEMADKAIELNYDYIGITDHFGKLKIANAIDENEFKDYIDEIEKTDDKIDNIKIYKSGEIEIDKEGNLEFDNELLKELDYVISSVHFSTKMDKDTMTKRIIKALQNPLTKILAHPTGRVIGKRPGFEFDFQEVFKVAYNEGVALEINAHPLRLDLNYNHVKVAKDIGCKLVINTDAHSVDDLDYMRFGLNNARKGWIEKKDLLTPADLSL